MSQKIKKVNRSFSIPQDIVDALGEYASSLGITRNAALVLILRKFLSDLRE